MGGLIATLLSWLLGLFGVGKPDPVRDARKETEARVRAESEATGLKKMIGAEHAIVTAEEEVHDARTPEGPAGPGTDLFGGPHRL